MLFLHLSFKYLLNSLFLNTCFPFFHTEDKITGKIIFLCILLCFLITQTKKF